MRRLLAAPLIALTLAVAAPGSVAAQQAGRADSGAAGVTPAPALPWAAERAPADTAVGGPRLPTLVRPAVDEALRDDTPAPAAQNKIVIPVTTVVIVLAVVVLILLID